MTHRLDETLRRIKIGPADKKVLGAADINLKRCQHKPKLHHPAPTINPSYTWLPDPTATYTQTSHPPPTSITYHRCTGTHKKSLMLLLLFGLKDRSLKASMTVRTEGQKLQSQND